MLLSLKLMSLVALAFVTVVAVLPTARADTPPFVFPDFCCYYNGTVVRTVTPPAAFPNEGRDNFYVVMSQAIIGVTGVAPGAIGYHGGHWKFHLVTWNVVPYSLTSEAAVLAVLDDERVVPAIKAGATSYLLKDVAAADLARAIRGARAGQAQLHPEVARRLMQQVTAPRKPEAGAQLTDREREVLRIIRGSIFGDGDRRREDDRVVGQ